MDNVSLPNVQAAKTHFETIPIANIDDPEQAMRSNMANENIDDLVRSIRQVGIIEPLVVRPKGDRFEIVAGHRRITAAEAAGLIEVPCFVVEASLEQTEMMKIHENLYRVDINPFDEANHYKRLMETMKISPARIAHFTNRGESYVRARLAVLEYEPALQQALAEGKIKLGVAQELSRITETHKLTEMLGWAVGNGITQAVARKWVDEQLPQNQPTGDFIPDPVSDQNFTPASEQHSKCFYCMQDVRLMEAYTVYVHDHCIKEREAMQAEEDASRDQPVT